MSEFDKFISVLLQQSEGEICGAGEKNRMWTGIDPVTVIEFLSLVDFEESKYRMPIHQRILPYIRRRLEKTSAELSKWNVICVGSGKANYARKIKSRKSSVTINSVIRTRVPDSNPPRVGASIAGPWDYIADLIEEPYSRPRNIFENSKGSFDRDLMFKERPKNNPLLLIYIIDPNSSPPSFGKGSTREPLFHDDASKVPVLGLAMALPKADISAEERNREREYYIRLGAASLEDILKSRRDIQ